jgi:O-antigen/teichoic acid export membrane protein
MNNLAIRFGNVMVRFLSIGSRFILLIVLARFLSAAELGQYGLFLATIIFLVSLLGALFYAHTTRELMAADRDHWPSILQHAMVGWGTICLALLPIVHFSGYELFGSTELSIWLVPVLLVEYLGHETVRVLIAIGRPITASLLMFVRMGSWVWIVIPLIWFLPELRHLGSVFATWTFAGVAALLLGWAAILRDTPAWRRVPVDWGWLRRGFSIGLLYLVGAVASRGLFTLDRYVVEYLAGPDQLGAYVLFIGLAMTVGMVVEAAVLTFLGPRLTNAAARQDLVEFDRIYKELTWSTLALGGVSALGVAAITPWLIEWIGKPYYAESMHLLWVLLLMAWIYCAGMVLDSALFACARDATLSRSALLGLLAFAAGAALAAGVSRVSAAAYGLLLSMVVTYLYRAHDWRNARRLLETSVTLKPPFADAPL